MNPTPGQDTHETRVNHFIFLVKNNYPPHAGLKPSLLPLGQLNGRSHALFLLPLQWRSWPCAFAAASALLHTVRRHGSHLRRIRRHLEHRVVLRQVHRRHGLSDRLVHRLLLAAPPHCRSDRNEEKEQQEEQQVVAALLLRGRRCRHRRLRGRRRGHPHDALLG